MQYTHEILAHAHKLNKEQGVPHSVIAKRLGTSTNSLSVTLHKWRKGTWKDQHSKVAAKRAEKEEMVKKDMTVGQMAKKLGQSAATVHTHLHRMGYDREVRNMEAGANIKRKYHRESAEYARLTELMQEKLKSIVSGL
jgi:IS30 family transposase